MLFIFLKEGDKFGKHICLCQSIMLTLRGIDEQGKWMPKQKNVYLKDENGERLPLIDKATGKQKVDKQNRKKWKCTTIPTNDWNSKWREELKKIDDSIGDIDKKFIKVANELARVEVLEHNKKELKLLLENERHKGRSERQLINEFQR